MLHVVIFRKIDMIHLSVKISKLTFGALVSKQCVEMLNYLLHVLYLRVHIDNLYVKCVDFRDH